MSLDVDGFDEQVIGGIVTMTVGNNHRLIKLAQKLPWDEMLKLVLPDLKRTDKKRWWMGRPLRIRIHLGAYILQQMFDLTDRKVEQALRDNAAYQLFCGHGLVKKWHIPDHTKIESFRSRLSAETQRKLANLISQQAVKLKFANPGELDVDSTVQEANIAYPALVNLLIKVAILAKTVAKGLNRLCHKGEEVFRVNIRHLKRVTLYYFRLKQSSKDAGLLKTVQKRLWRETYAAILPVLNQLHRLTPKINRGKYGFLRRSVEKLRWRGCQLLQQAHGWLFEGSNNGPIIHSLHAYEVACFNKGKLHKGLEFGRAFQLGRIGGNFLFVGECTSTHMPDAPSLPAMVRLHQRLYGEDTLASIATDKGYYSRDNEKMLEKAGVQDIYLPRPERVLDAPPEKTTGDTRALLHNRRAGIEPLIAHTKQGGQLGRSRMKSDEATKSAGYAAVFGFNLRQLMRYITGEVRLEPRKTIKNEAKRTKNNSVLAITGSR
ncbi:TPA: transposase [Legionella pneumophila]|nr:transposase [Legionella pneumophila]HBD7092941.1 transposase [Legionella pneumophila]HBD9280504.1 transposase [Legionella pneumophila]